MLKTCDLEKYFFFFFELEFKRKEINGLVKYKIEQKVVDSNFLMDNFTS